MEGSQVIDLSDSWAPSRAGHPGFVGNRLLPTAVLFLLGDWLLLLAGFVLVSRLRFGGAWIDVWNGAVPQWQLLVPLYLTIGSASAWVMGFYELRPSTSWWQDVKRAVGSVAVLTIATMAVLFVSDHDHVSRLFLAIYFPLIVVGMIGERSAARRWLRRRRAAGKGILNVLVVGSGATAEGFTIEATAHEEAGVNVVGFLDAPGRTLRSYPRLGTVADLELVLQHVVVDEVVVCLPLDDWARIGRIAATAELQGKSIRIPMHVPGTSHGRSRLDHLAGVPVLSVVSTPDQPLANAAKRSVDILLAGTTMIVLAPIMAVTALAILLFDGRPVFFSQRRVGLHGRTFVLRKFRTMVVDAESRLSEVAHLNERQGPVFKAAADPRVTALGRFLRATSLDELPQLWNVLRKDMSLVGPRPPIPSEVEQYDPWHRRRLSMRPGVTGLWQVSNRNEPNFDNWVSLDLQYIDSWTVVADLRILARTIPAVLKLTGR
jgi:exopolysaccharide biosynthesis polyprenyl glycosylphosphotransferase